MFPGALRATMVVLGGVAIAFGTLALLTGVSRIPEAGAPGASVDSELRFYAAWYVAAGVALLRSSRHPQLASSTVRLVCGALIVGASARVLSLITVGRPATVFLVLAVIEYGIAAVLLPWQSLVSRAAKRSPSPHAEQESGPPGAKY